MSASRRPVGVDPGSWRVLRRPPRSRLLRRAVVAVVGTIVLLAGVAMLVLPGPGWLTIFAGLAVLALEFTWARLALAYGKRTVSSGALWFGAQPRWVRVGSAIVGVALLVVAMLLAVMRYGGPR